MSDSSDDADEDQSDPDNPRLICAAEDILKFDPNFSLKRWDKLSDARKKTISGILNLKTDKVAAGIKSNRIITLDRQHYLTACRGLYSCFFSPRRAFDAQDEAMISFVETYRNTQYYSMAKIVPKLFSVSAVQKYAQNYHVVHQSSSFCLTFSVCI